LLYIAVQTAVKLSKYKARPGLWFLTVPAKHTASGKREVHYFNSRNAGKEWISRFQAEHAEHGIAIVTGEERRWINFCRDQVGDLSLLPKILEHWKASGPDSLNPLPVEEVVSRFLQWRPAQGRWSPSTAEDTKSRLGIFQAAFQTRFIHELTATEIEGFLSGRGAAGTQVKFFNKLRPLFRYAKRHRFLAINPFENIEPASIEYREIEIYTPEELQRMLTVAEQLYPDLVPFIALTAFGFMRTEELVRRSSGDIVLEWGAFDWQEKQIFVPHSVAKKAKNHGGNDRSIPFNPALLHWLEPYVKESGRVVEREEGTAQRALRKIRRTADVRDIANGLRHSCLTYWMAANGEESIGTVARWSGNSPAIAKRHYVATVKRAQGAAWLAIRRS
jgi:site-specific recombinase XerD